MQVESTSNLKLTVDEVEKIQRNKVANIIEHVFQLTYAAFFDKLVQEEKIESMLAFFENILRFSKLAD